MVSRKQRRELEREIVRLQAEVVRWQALADRDTLTPLDNRRAFLRKLEARLKSCDAARPSVLMFVDLDGLKTVNDSYGHAAGDAALIHVAQHLTRSIRATDIAGRLGGDEFALFLAGADASKGRERAAELLGSLRAHPLQFGRHVLPLGISVGVTQVSADETVDQLLERSDEEMYRSKAARSPAAPPVKKVIDHASADVAAATEFFLVRGWTINQERVSAAL